MVVRESLWTLLRTIASEPTVFENYVQDIKVDDNVVEMSLWDTAGNHLFTHSSYLSPFHQARKTLIG